MSYVHPIDTATIAVFFLVHPTTGEPITGVSSAIAVKVRNASYTESETGTATEIGNGLYYYSFTPDANGVWTITFTYDVSTPQQVGGVAFIVGADLNTKIDTIDTVVDGNATLLGHGTYGLAALKTLIDTLDSVVDGNAAILGSGTYGNSALKTLIDAVKVVVDANSTKLSHATYGLSAIRTYLETIRGADSDTLETLSDQIDTLPTGPIAVNTTMTVQNNTDEQTLLEIQPEGTVTRIDGIKLDIDALTKVCTIKVYEKIDDTNYREDFVKRQASVPASIPLLTSGQITISRDFKITITMAEAEGTTKTIYIQYHKEEL